MWQFQNVEEDNTPVALRTATLTETLPPVELQNPHFSEQPPFMRHYATSRKVAGSIPDEVNDSSIDPIIPAALWPLFRLGV
jgi:hypothetical protein